MADIVIFIAEKLIEVTGSAVIQEICDMWGYKSKLEELNKTVFKIKNVLLDAESKRELTNYERAYIDELKDAVYDADDLFDEFFTLAELKQLRPLSKRGKLFEKVRCFFSSKNQVGQAYRMARQVKDIKRKLDIIANDHQKFGFSVDYKPIIRRREETCSYVDAGGIIGRENDKKAIIDMLLGSNNVDEHVHSVTIVGVGGMGKTALAQLVFNDSEVEKEFPNPKLRLWVCVSDQDGGQFDVKSILCKILESISGRKVDDTTAMELIQRKFQESLSGKKYLLVLDDMWNEDLDKWLNLKQFLILGQEESKIIVTTRSKRTAEIIGNKHTYQLKGLCPDDSWRLFEKTSFIKENEPKNYLKFVNIGKKIVTKCYNVPLAIKVVGSLLYGQDISMWSLFEERGLYEIDRSKGTDGIMFILKSSYHNLKSSLKCCFSYCALFPKDKQINKEILISLWIAQGYIVPFHVGQSIEDAAEEHFLILLRRCFFQDVERDIYGGVRSVKIHDLIHDVALEVGRDEISVSGSLGDKIRHVSYDGDRCPDRLEFKSKRRIRSFIFRAGPEFVLSKTNTDNWMSLRVLDFKGQNFRSLPHAISKLVHLRFLNLGSNYELETLSDSITKLHNLETLILCGCSSLRELSKNISKLVKLRHLDLEECEELTSMPSDMDKLTNMRVLPYFAVGKGTDEKQCDGKLEDLKALTNLSGRIRIDIGGNYGDQKVVNDIDREGVGYVKNTKHLSELKIVFNSYCVVDFQEDVLDKLEPHENLKGFILEYYKGRRISRWGRAEDNWAFTFTHPVQIQLESCMELEELPSLSELPYLKSLKLRGLKKLEYMESSRSSSNPTSLFFPSLESLWLLNLESLKGWWKGEELVDDNEDDHQVLRMMTFSFPRLLKLDINNCPELMSFPPCCPTLEFLCSIDVDAALRIRMVNKMDKEEDSLGISYYDVPPLRKILIDNVDNLITLLGGISEDDSDIPWKSLNNTLRQLEFLCLEDCQMPIAANSLQHLTSLKQLTFYGCTKLEALPEWIGNLSSLQYLEIKWCDALKSLPDSMRNLTSLKSLEITVGPELKERCTKPNGEDWPKIQHIPQLYIIG